MDALVEGLMADIREVFGADRKRIDHALAVLAYANHIRAREGGDPLVIQAAALLHDIGIQEAERKHGSAAGRWQELEGPPIAERILRQRGVDEERVAHIGRIVANHHSARDIDTLEFRILWDADWLVNWPEMNPEGSPSDAPAGIRRIFRTNTGRETALRLFVGG